jgi:hypothetical protein
MGLFQVQCFVDMHRGFPVLTIAGEEAFTFRRYRLVREQGIVWQSG